MDDLEFRRRAYAEPDCQDADFIEHIQQSNDDAQFVEELKLIDEKLKQAVHIQPPDDLAERIKLNQTLNEHQASRKRWQLWSMVASLVIVSALVFSYFPKPPESLEENVLQHIYHELNHLDDRHNSSLTQVNKVLSGVGAQAIGSFGQMNYLGSCEIDNKPGVHMVVQGEEGSVTVFLLPNTLVKKERLISDSRFDGIIVPAGKGSMAVVGEKGEPLESIRQVMHQNLNWI